MTRGYRFNKVVVNCLDAFQLLAHLLRAQGTDVGVRVNTIALRKQAVCFKELCALNLCTCNQISHVFLVEKTQILDALFKMRDLGVLFSYRCS
eukprot:XP_001708387.1 Hypothetical protein GL50803_104104 [Giardia lamblia ATCC 50803]